jgi:AcrR family transcriptional regulator
VGSEDPRPAPAAEKKSGRRSERAQQGAPLLPGASPELPPTAKRLLDAAHRLLVRSGYNALSVAAIGQEAGENKALIRYYFGSKDGLLVALTDALISQTLQGARQRLASLSGTHDRVGVAVDTMQSIAADTPSFRLLFELLPRLLENQRMTRQLADLYAGYREVNVRALWGDRPGEPPPVVYDLAAILVALPDGLAVQTLAQPGSVDVRRTLDAMRDYIEGAMAAVDAQMAGAALQGPA